MSQKFIFFVYEVEDGLGYAYCAKSREQAKYLYAQDFGVDYIDVRARKIKPAPQDFAIGEIDDWQWCLKEGIYSWVEEVECPHCGTVGDVFYDKNKGFYCDYCKEEVFKESHDESGHHVFPGEHAIQPSLEEKGRRHPSPSVLSGTSGDEYDYWPGE